MGDPRECTSARAPSVASAPHTPCTSPVRPRRRRNSSSEARPPEPVRLPCVHAVPQPPAGLPARPLLELDQSPESALNVAAHLLEHSIIRVPDGLLDPVDLAADLRVELGWARVSRPVGEHRPGAARLLPGPADGHDVVQGRLRHAVPGPELQSRAGGQTRGQPRAISLPLRVRSDRPEALPAHALARVCAGRGERGGGRQLRHGLLRDRRPGADRAVDPACAGQARHLRAARRGARDGGRPAGPSTSPSGCCWRRARRSASRIPATRTWSAWPGSRGSTSSGFPSTKRG